MVSNRFCDIRVRKNNSRRSIWRNPFNFIQMWIVQLGSPAHASLDYTPPIEPWFTLKDRVACHSRKFDRAEGDSSWNGCRSNLFSEVRLQWAGSREKVWPLVAAELF